VNIRILSCAERELAEGVLVLAIMHLRRDPKVWQERVGEGD